MEITNLNIKLPSVNLNDSESKLAEITNKSNAKSDKNFKKVLDNKISSKESAKDVNKDINYETKNVQDIKTTNEVEVKENPVPVKDVPLDKVDVKEIDVSKTPTLDEAYIKDVDTNKTPLDEAYTLMDLIISMVSDSNEVQAIEENMEFDINKVVNIAENIKDIIVNDSIDVEELVTELKAISEEITLEMPKSEELKTVISNIDSIIEKLDSNEYSGEDELLMEIIAQGMIEQNVSLNNFVSDKNEDIEEITVQAVNSNDKVAKEEVILENIEVNLDEEKVVEPKAADLKVEKPQIKEEVVAKAEEPKVKEEKVAKEEVKVENLEVKEEAVVKEEVNVEEMQVKEEVVAKEELKAEEPKVKEEKVAKEEVKVKEKLVAKEEVKAEKPQLKEEVVVKKEVKAEEMQVKEEKVAKEEVRIEEPKVKKEIAVKQEIKVEKPEIVSNSKVEVLNEEVSSRVTDIKEQITKAVDDKDAVKIVSEEIINSKNETKPKTLEVIKNNDEITSLKDTIETKTQNNADTNTDDSQNKGFTKEDRVLKSLTDDSDKFIINRHLAINSEFTVKSVQNINNEIVVNEATMTEDIVKSVKFIATNGLRELTVKINPNKLGEMTISIMQEDGALKANLKATTKEAYDLISKHLHEVTKVLEEQNVKIQKIDVTLENNTNNNNNNGQEKNPFSENLFFNMNSFNGRSANGFGRNNFNKNVEDNAEVVVQENEEIKETNEGIDALV